MTTMEFDRLTEKLFVGSCPTAGTDIEFLKKSGITAVFTVQTDEDFDFWGIDWKKFEKQYRDLGIAVRRVPVPDFDTQALRRKLPECVAALDELLKQGHTVFLHCNAGVNRSPTIAIAYLHWIEHWTLQAAVDHVMVRHSCDPYVETIEQAGGAQTAASALIIVDLQNDFCPGGALPVPQGDQVIPLVNELQPKFDLAVATQDWHPADHGSFAANHPGKKPGDVIELAGLAQILWPVHCVQNTPGAELHPMLDQSKIEHVFRKGEDPLLDSYSGFFDNGRRRATGLGDYLKGRGVSSVYVCGLAADYCVKFTALDAVRLGFETFLLENACRGVNLQPGDVQRAVEEMLAHGVRRI